MTKPTRAEKTLKRQIAIVDAACECFIAKGFHQTSMRDIASKAGVSLGNLYNHFEGKEALVSAIARLEADEQAEAIRRVDKIRDPGKALRKFITEYLRMSKTQENVSLTAEIMAEALRNPDIAQAFLQNHQNLLDTLSAILSRAQEAEKIDSDVNCDDAAEFILDAAEGAAFRMVLAPARHKGTADALMFMIKKYLGLKG